MVSKIGMYYFVIKRKKTEKQHSISHSYQTNRYLEENHKLQLYTKEKKMSVNERRIAYFSTLSL